MSAAMRVAPDVLSVGAAASIRDAMLCIDRNAKGAALVLDAERRLLGIVTDGDVRRAILSGADLEAPVLDLCCRIVASRGSDPVTAPSGTPAAELLHMFNSLGLRHIPLLDADGRVDDVAILTDLVREAELPLTAVIMAGGYGTRLEPLTASTPKPMLQVGDRPLLERIVCQLRDAGIRRVNLATHYRHDQIAEHFGSGREFGVEISYVREDSPLGTAGALGRVDAQDDHILVINGDVLTSVDFAAMLAFHREHRAAMTVGIRRCEFRVPYGVVTMSGSSVSAIEEKPLQKHFVAAGVYLLDLAVRTLLPPDRSYDMPELIARLVADDWRVVGFPIHEYWIDIGRPEDYRQAIADVAGSAG